MILFYVINIFFLGIIAFLAIALSLQFIHFNSIFKKTNKTNKPIYGFIDPEIVYRELYENKKINYIVIDVRQKNEYHKGHLLNAHNIPVNDFNFKTLLALDKYNAYIIYGQRHNSSKKALDIMKLYGFTHVYCMTGGIIEWKLREFPIVKSQLQTSL